MVQSNSYSIILACAAQLFVIPALGCSADSATEEQLRDSAVANDAEAALETALRALDDQDIVFSYYEKSSSVDVVVELEQVSRLARGFTIEFQLDVVLPDGTNVRHELDWTSGDDDEVPRIAFPSAGSGRYEATVSNLAIDGRPLVDGLTLTWFMELRANDGRAAAPGELGLLAPDTSQVVAWCGQGNPKFGFDNFDDVLHGGDSNNAMYGRSGNDSMWGYECNDTLYGEAGDDTLRGGGGVDVCHGGLGLNDSLINCEYPYPEG
jgi:hypothetical protein